jgi:hypothetical protein
MKGASQKGVLYLHFFRYLKVQFPEHLSRRTIFIIEVTVQNKAENLLIRVMGSLAILDDINPLISELNPSEQRCLTRFLLGILLLAPYISLIYA